MADRISSDHPSVQTVRGTLTETATGVRLELPASERERFPVDEVVRVVLDGDELFANVTRPLGGGEKELHVPGIYDSPRFARDPREGPDRLPSWRDTHGIRPGGSVLVDVVEPNFLYGLRAPGETAYYDAREPPQEGLTEIAKSLERGEFDDQA